MDDLLARVKQNLILSHSADDDLLSSFITAARFLCRKLSAHQRRLLFRASHAADYGTGSDYVGEPFLRIKRWLDRRFLCRQRASRSAGMEYGQSASAARPGLEGVT